MPPKNIKNELKSKSIIKYTIINKFKYFIFNNPKIKIIICHNLILILQILIIERLNI
jgi:hypothetical protein